VAVFARTSRPAGDDLVCADRLAISLAIVASQLLTKYLLFPIDRGAGSAPT